MTYLLVVHNSSNGLSVRIGSWAQLLAALGAVAAAGLALSTAKENREQAENANLALAASTRPLLSLTIYPAPEQLGHCADDQEFTLLITNHSPFDAPRCRVNWSMGDDKPRDAWGDRLFADPDHSKGFFSGGVRYAGDASTSARASLGTAKEWRDGKLEVRLYYASPFANGGWMERHNWNVWNTSDDPEKPHWDSKHTMDTPTWMTLANMGF